MRILDAISDLLGLVAAWLFFLTGVLLSYEVTARYVFAAPTVWAAEISQILLIIGTFIAVARALRRREHITITMLTDMLSPQARRWMETAALFLMACLSMAITWYGGEIALDSFLHGRTAGTLLNVPNWWTEAAVPFGFALLSAQCCAEIIRLARGEEPIRAGGHGE